MNFRSLRYSLIALLSVGLLCSDAQAVTAANAYVTVSSSTYGVEDIAPVGADFYVTTRNVGKPSFRADISVRANSPYYLVIPANGRMNLGIGESGLYRVKDESGNEDVFSGRVYVLKLDIEPAETNVCWKSTSCTLKLTDFSEGVPVIVTYGLWGNRPQTTQGSDVHMNYEHESGKYNRHFLVKPSQVASFAEFISRKCEWSYFYTCADWAEDGYRIATGETISANDIVGFGTPRAVGRSINSAESRNPTIREIPFDGGEHASSSSIGDDSSNESSFP